MFCFETVEKFVTIFLFHFRGKQRLVGANTQCNILLPAESVTEYPKISFSTPSHCTKSTRSFRSVDSSQTPYFLIVTTPHLPFSTLFWLFFFQIIPLPLSLSAMDGSGNSAQETVACASWIRRPENAHLVAMGRRHSGHSDHRPSSLQIFSFDRESTALSTSPLVLFFSVYFCFKF